MLKGMRSQLRCCIATIGDGAAADPAMYQDLYGSILIWLGEGTAVWVGIAAGVHLPGVSNYTLLNTALLSAGLQVAACGACPGFESRI